MDIKSLISGRMAQAIVEKVFPGAVIGYIRGGTRQIIPLGNLTYDADSPVVKRDTVYDVASITKSIPTASLVLSFIHDGKMRLNDRVRDYVPELQNDYDATIEDLLRYRVYGEPMSIHANKSPEEIRQYIFEHGFHAPASEAKYTNLPAFLLGIIAERVGSDRLDDLAEENFFMPLGMSRTWFGPNITVYETTNIAPTEIDRRGEIKGLPHDESAHVFARRDTAVGHAGLFSAADDILNFLEGLLQGRFPHIVAGAQIGLGWQVNQDYFLGKYSREKTFGKTGFTGTSCAADADCGIAFVILSNRTYPKRPQNDDAINEFRRSIADIVLRDD